MILEILENAVFVQLVKTMSQFEELSQLDFEKSPEILLPSHK